MYNFGLYSWLDLKEMKRRQMERRQQVKSILWLSGGLKFMPKFRLRPRISSKPPSSFISG